MDLRNGRRRERHGVHALEDVLQGDPQVGLHGLADNGKWHRRRRVQALLKLRDVLRREERGRGGDELAQLHVGGAQALEELPEDDLGGVGSGAGLEALQLGEAHGEEGLCGLGATAQPARARGDGQLCGLLGQLGQLLELEGEGVGVGARGARAAPILARRGSAGAAGPAADQYRVGSAIPGGSGS